MISVAICDDDSEVSNQLKELISSFDSKAEIDIYNDNKILVNQNNFDLYFLDIEIGDDSGIDYAKEIRKNNTNAIIIFITSFTSYISDAFDVLPFQYLVKPINEIKLLDVYKKAKTYITNIKQFVQVSWNGLNEVVLCCDIVYIERMHRKVIFYMHDGSTKSSSLKFNEYIKFLDCYGFVRTHNSFLVNFTYVKNIKQYDIILDNDQTIPISKKYLLDVKNTFAKKISGEIIC